MGGLSSLFKKILPFIMIICLVCFGITYAFKPLNEKQLTYLTTQYYDIETGNQIYNPTEEEIQNAEITYYFDMVSYVENADQNILTRATTNIIDYKAYTDTANNFNSIWQDGYQFGDITNTILNGILMVVNTITLIINMIIFPVRLISGILLTGMSLIGININNGIIIIPVLKFFVDNFAIPFIQPTDQKAAYDNALKDTQWTWNITKLNQALDSFEFAGQYSFTLKFSSLPTNDREEVFTVFIATKQNNKIQITYANTRNHTEKLVYNNGWVYNNAKTITILDNYLTAQKVAEYRTQLLKAFNETTPQRSNQPHIYYKKKYNFA